MRCSQLFVFFFLLIHSVASLPTPLPGLLTSAKRSQPQSHYENPTTAAEAQAPSSSRGTQDAQTASSVALPFVQGLMIQPRLEDTNDEDAAHTSLLPRLPARTQPADNWKKPLMGIGIIGTFLTALGGLASYKAWRKERDRRKKEEEEAKKGKAQPPGVQHPVVQAPQDGPWCMGC